MAALYLIRHGQASFGEPEYDLLTNKGRQQSAILGQSWQALPIPDKIYTGKLTRHIQTFENFNQQLEHQFIPTQISELNEFDHNDILLNSQTQWQCQQDVIDYFKGRSSPKTELTLAFNQAIETWIKDADSQQFQENWSMFKNRCLKGLQHIVDARKQEEHHIFAFTSGGVIAVIIQHLLKLTDKHCLLVMQQLRNTSVTKVLFSGDRISLDYYNNYRHLEQVGASWSTYR